MSAWSTTFTYLDGEWIEGNRPIVGPRTHAFWLGSSVFDGARAFEGVTPDLVQCTRWRRNNAYSIVMCVRAVERLFVLNGMRGMKADDPVQRAWREVHAAGCQAGNTWDLNATNYGKARFGLMTGDPRVGG